MKRIGLIDNLQDLGAFVIDRLDGAVSSEIMAATGGNTGNVAFVHAAKKIIGNPITRIEWGTDAELIKRTVDHLVICCANQLGAHADLGGWAERIRDLNIPVTLIGLGAQADDLTSMPEIPEGTKKFLAVVKSLSAASVSNIAVRGDFTKKVLDSCETPALPIGCPSLHISNVKNLGRVIHSRSHSRSLKRVAVAAGNPWHGPSAPLEKLLLKILDDYQGEYFIQHPLAMIQYSLGEVDSIEDKVKSRFDQVYDSAGDFDGLIEWFRRRSVIYVDPANWINAMRRYDVALGPRYHGVALGVQAGIPGLVITIDSRTEELCLGTGLKYIPLDRALSSDPHDLLQMAKWDETDAQSFDNARYVRANQYVDFLKDNGMEPSKHLMSCAE